MPRPPFFFVLSGLALLFLLSSAQAATSPSLLEAVMSDTGWVFVRDGEEAVKVYRKTIPGKRLYAWKGEKLTPAPPDVLFNAITDVPGALTVDPKRIPVKVSEVLARRGDGVDLVQVLKVPAWLLFNDRYWFVRTTWLKNIGGVVGKHMQKWIGIEGTSAYPEKAKVIAADWKGAVELEESAGAWETLPTEDGKTRLVFRTYSDPSGNIPTGGQNFATGKTLPDNLNAYDRRARKIAGIP